VPRAGTIGHRCPPSVDERVPDAAECRPVFSTYGQLNADKSATVARPSSAHAAPIPRAGSALTEVSPDHFGPGCSCPNPEIRIAGPRRPGEPRCLDTASRCGLGESYILFTRETEPSRANVRNRILGIANQAPFWPLEGEKPDWRHESCMRSAPARRSNIASRLR